MKKENPTGWCTSNTTMQAEIMGQVYKDTTELEWVSHPLNENVKLAFILTQKNDQVNVTCLLAKVPKEEDIPEHTHPVHDIIYPLSGKGKIWIKGLGDLELKKGVLVSVPPKVPHKVYEVTEDMEIYDVFSDAIL